VASTFGALAQKAEKPQAYLFDEFRVTTETDVIARTKRLRSKLRETKSSEKPEGAYLVFFYAKKKQPFSVRNLVVDALFKDCLDCLGFSPRIVFRDIKNSTEQKVQFWLLPSGADFPADYPAVRFKPINDPNKPDWEILPQEARAG